VDESNIPRCVWLKEALPFSFSIGRARYEITGPSEYPGRIVHFIARRLDVAKDVRLSAFVEYYQFPEWFAHPFFDCVNGPETNLALALIKHGYAVAAPLPEWQFRYEQISWSCVPIGTEYLTMDGRKWLTKKDWQRENFDFDDYRSRIPAITRTPLDKVKFVMPT
jgi:hypothetical protein